MLRIEGLHSIFNINSVNEIHALKKINLHIPAKQFVTLIGGNGAGKSTLFNVIAGVIAPTEGKIWLDGNDITSWSETKRATYIGRVFQNPLEGTAKSMTIAENITLAMLRSRTAKLLNGTNAERRRKIAELLRSLDLELETRLDDPVALLSSGQRQAMTLLMATLVKPKILLLDEHTASLDPSASERILEITNQIINSNQLTALMITHNMQQALKYGDRTLMLHEGQIILDLNAKEKKQMQVEDLIDVFFKLKNLNMAEVQSILI